jgi:hypothetical protein
MDIYDIIQGCSDALRKMGSIALSRSIYIASVTNYCVNLPGTVWKVRGAYRIDGSPNLPITVTVDDIYFPPQEVFVMEESTIEPTVKLIESNYVPQFKGPYVDYVWDCPLVKFNETEIPVAIEVTGVKVDEEKYPMIPEPNYYGCLYYCLYVYYQPLFLLQQVPPAVMGQVEEWMNQNVAQSNQSAMMEALTANERDKLFNIMTSMDRKSFNYPV